MGKQSFQAKNDGLAQTLIERVAPVLVKTRLVLLHHQDRSKMKVEQVLSAFSLISSDLSSHHLDSKDELIPRENWGEMTIEKWLNQIIKSSSTIRSICSAMEEILKHNWCELHHQLGLPSLLPFYFFIINVLLDVMIEYLKFNNKQYQINENIEMDSLSRQQVRRFSPSD